MSHRGRLIALGLLALLLVGSLIYALSPDDAEPAPAPRVGAEEGRDDHNDHDEELPEGVSKADTEAASAAATSAILAYLTQRSDESKAQRASRLQPLFTDDSPVPAGPPPLNNADFPDGSGFATAPSLSFMSPRDGDTDELRYFASAELSMAVTAGGETVAPSGTAIYDVTVRRVGNRWVAADVDGEVDLPEGFGGGDGSGKGATGKAPDVEATKPFPLPTKDMLSITQKYVGERENAMSFRHASVRDWVSRVKPLMTPEGWKALNARVGEGDRGGAQRDIALENRWSVRVRDLDCFHHPSGGRPTATKAVVFCSAEEETVTADGTVVPPSALPIYWSYSGPIKATLELRRSAGGAWKVHQDRTSEF